MYDIEVRIKGIKRGSYRWEIVQVHDPEDYSVLRFGTARSYLQAAKNAEVPLQSETQLAKKREEERAAKATAAVLFEHARVLDEGAGKRRRTG